MQIINPQIDQTNFFQRPLRYHTYSNMYSLNHMKSQITRFSNKCWSQKNVGALLLYIFVEAIYRNFNKTFLKPIRAMQPLMQLY